MTVAKPASRPNVPHFSSGPCAKRPGWNPQNLKDAALGRSHRAKVGKAKLKLAIELTREVLEVPADYKIGIVPASDTGAVEMALWSLLGARPVTTIAWESFGEGWVSDIVKELKLKDVTKLHAGYGEIPDLSKADPASDIVFTWNGTTSGVRVPNADWISAKREGLTICDATSAAFAQALDWPKLDVVTFSWQKALGGEAAHGMLVLSPRAVERLESYKPAWPLPKIFLLHQGHQPLGEVGLRVRVKRGDRRIDHLHAHRGIGTERRVLRQEIDPRRFRLPVGEHPGVGVGARDQGFEAADRFRPVQRVEIILDAQHRRRVDGFALKNTFVEL